jgi:hypothetical protein
MQFAHDPMRKGHWRYGIVLPYHLGALLQIDDK